MVQPLPQPRKGEPPVNHFKLKRRQRTPFADLVGEGLGLEECLVAVRCRVEDKTEEVLVIEEPVVPLDVSGLTKLAGALEFSPLSARTFLSA
jgi:hypothetical protein